MPRAVFDQAPNASRPSLPKMAMPGEAAPAAAAPASTQTRLPAMGETAQAKEAATDAAPGAAPQSEKAAAAEDWTEQLRAETKRRRNATNAASMKRELDEANHTLSRILENPIEALAEKGIGWEKLTADKLAAKNLPVAKSKEVLRIEALEKEIADTKKLAAEAKAQEPITQRQEAERYLQEWRQETFTAVAALDKAKFEHLHALPNGGQLVAKLMIDTLQKTGQNVALEDAAASVEKDLTTQLPAQVKTLLSNPTWRRLALAELKEELAAANKSPFSSPRQPRERADIKMPDQKQPLAPVLEPRLRAAQKVTPHSRWAELTKS